MAPFRWRGHLSQLDTSLAVADNATLRGYVDRLAVTNVGGRPLGRTRARGVVERLLVGALDEIGGEFTARIEQRFTRVQQLRGQLQGRYDRVLALFAPGAPPLHALPADLSPGSISRLFDELDRALDDLEADASRRALDDVMTHTDRTRDVRDAELDAARRAGDDAAVLPDPDLPLDPLPDRGDPRMPGEHDRAALAAYRERMRLSPESPALRRRVREAAVAWAQRVLPGSDVTIYRVPDYSEGNLAALARFGELDPHFSGRGYEVQLRLPDGTRFRPDGIRFFDEQGTRFQFLESKEPYTWTQGSFYATPHGQAGLLRMLERDAAIAQRLRGNGCQGFRYETGHPDLDRVLANAITDMRQGSVPGADLLSAP